jgi:hypothetical protein
MSNDTSTTLSASRYTHQEYPTTPTPAATLLECAQGLQDGRSGLPLPETYSVAYGDSHAIGASRKRVREYGAAMRQMAARFTDKSLRSVSAQAADAVAEAQAEGLVR